MTAAPASVLAINAGSSSLKFAVCEEGESRATLRGKLDRIGLDRSTLSWTTAKNESSERPVQTRDSEEATALLLDWLRTEIPVDSIAGVGHRIVHGLSRTEPVLVTSDILEELRRAAPYAPEHLPREISVIEAVRERYPQLPNVGCFDTAFHSTMPRVAKQLPIPRRYFEKGVHRYGFHGLSYQYLMDELVRIAGGHEPPERVVLAHLGNGSSLAAVKAGKSIDTSMGFTPAAGVVMSTRTGDLDPGLVAFLANTEGMTASQYDRMVNHESGLLGVSELSSDVRDLLAREVDDVRAADALSLFTYQIRKWIGAFAAALGGLDALVFSAGIGEHSATIRARICEGLAFLGIELDETRNQSHGPVISSGASRVTVRIIPTDEEQMIARSAFRVLRSNS